MSYLSIRISRMKLKNLENIYATNDNLRNRQYTILGLTAEDIPIRIRPDIQHFLENVIIKTRNFIPGDLEYTIRLFNQVHGAEVQPGTEPILLLALQRKATIAEEFLPNTDDPLDEWVEVKRENGQDAIQRGAALGPVLCLPEFCPYSANIRRRNQEMEQRSAEIDAKLELLKSIVNNVKHLMQRLLSNYDQNQRTFEQTTNEILNLLYQTDE